eukprot:1421294-Pyramimonas_sp.AAC.1
MDSFPFANQSVLHLELTLFVPPGLCPWHLSDHYLDIFRPRNPAPDSNPSVWQRVVSVHRLA